MGAFIGCLAIAVVLVLHGLDFLKELKLIRQELEKLNEQREEDPLARVCYRYLPEMQHLMETGEASEELITHIDSCAACRDAINKVRQMEEVADDLHEDA